jgi:hypothetical protein
MTKGVIIGWIMELVGTGLWIYGYFSVGHSSILDWQAISPSWIAEWLRNLESEVGMVFVFAGMVPIYWPRR